MPINIDKNLPAATTLANEGIFVMTNERAAMQDIRPLKIAILNLMPTKETTETQLLRLLGNSPLQVEIILLRTLSHTPSHVSQEYLESFYHSFDDIKNTKLDGLIITGAPVELMKFEEVDYWDELTEIMEWSRSHVYSTMHICWAAQAGLYYHYGIEKHTVDKKVFGVFRHKVIDRTKYQLTRGFDDYFYAPHSRHTAIMREDVEKDPRLDIVSESDEAGVYLISAKGGRQIFVTGHAEYDRGTLGAEYTRDVKKGIDIDVPLHYYPDDDPSRRPYVSWRSHAHLLFANWLNYYVYQNTPFAIEDIDNDNE